MLPGSPSFYKPWVGTWYYSALVSGLRVPAHVWAVKDPVRFIHNQGENGLLLVSQ